MRTTPLLRGKKSSPAGSLFGLFAVVLAAAVVTALYFGRDLLVPLALAALLAFVLSPLVTRLERFIGRLAAVSGVVTLSLCLIVAVSWVVARQAMDVMEQLPGYRMNIEKKIRSLEPSNDGALKRFSKMVEEIEAEIPALGAPPVASTEPAAAETNAPRLARARAREAAAPPAPTPPPAPVAVKPPSTLTRIPLLIRPLLEVLASAGLVIVLVVFMLLKREDLRGRLIKITGQGRISSTSRVI